jgi:hypothetical protein
MSDIEIKRRFVAIMCGIDYDKFLRGQLSESEEQEFLDNLDMFAEMDDLPVSRLTSTGEGCVTELIAAIDEYRANIVFIDGLNYLSTDWKELAEILRGIKRVAQDKNIPIVASTHANRSRGKKGSDDRDSADDFAYGDAFYQVCDVALRVTSDLEDKRHHQVKMFTAAIREGSPVLFTIHTHLAENLGQKSVEQIPEEDSTGSADDELAKDHVLMDQASDNPDENLPSLVQPMSGAMLRERAHEYKAKKPKPLTAPSTEHPHVKAVEVARKAILPVMRGATNGDIRRGSGVPRNFPPKERPIQ